jgi:hypothetical protein
MMMMPSTIGAVCDFRDVTAAACRCFFPVAVVLTDTRIARAAIISHAAAHPVVSVFRIGHTTSLSVWSFVVVEEIRALACPVRIISAPPIVCSVSASVRIPGPAVRHALLLADAEIVGRLRQAVCVSHPLALCGRATVASDCVALQTSASRANTAFTSDAALDAVASVVPVQEISTLPIAVADPEFPVRVLTIITLAGHVPAAPILAFRAHRFTLVVPVVQVRWLLPAYESVATPI